MRLLHPFGCALLIVLAAALVANAGDRQRVKRVMDGDTILLESGQRVQLLGIRTPKTKRGTKQAEPFGEEACKFTKRLVEDKKVRLEFDPKVESRDKHSKTFAYLFLLDGTLVNGEIVREGYGVALRNPSPLRYEADLIRLEMMARRHRRGIWAQAPKGK